MMFLRITTTQCPADYYVVNAFKSHAHIQVIQIIATHIGTRSSDDSATGAFVGDFPDFDELGLEVCVFGCINRDDTFQYVLTSCVLARHIY